MDKHPGLLDRDFVTRMKDLVRRHPVARNVSAAWFCGETYRATIVAILSLVGRPVKPEVFKELSENEEEWEEFAGAITELIHAGRIEPVNGKLVICKKA